MICPECRGRGWTPAGGDGDEPDHEPCPYCEGAPPADFYTQAEIERSQRRIGALLESYYRDDTYEERACDCCSRPYRGPAVYCSLTCALDDA
jgi:hypothetical protein